MCKPRFLGYIMCQYYAQKFGTTLQIDWYEWGCDLFMFLVGVCCVTVHEYAILVQAS